MVAITIDDFSPKADNLFFSRTLPLKWHAMLVWEYLIHKGTLETFLWSLMSILWKQSTGPHPRHIPQV